MIMRKILGLFVCMLFIATAILPIVGTMKVSNSFVNDEVLDQYQERSDQCKYIDGYEWQEFIPTMNNLVRVEVKVAQWNIGSPDLEMTIEKPLGNVLSSKKLPASSIPSGSCGWVSFDVPDISLNPGVNYYIKLFAPVGSEYGWGIAWNNLYPKGESSQPPGDWCFRTYAQELEVKKLSISLNRDAFVYGEPVAITVENDGEIPVNFHEFPGIEIYNSLNDKVFPWFVDQEEYILAPGESVTYVWDQRGESGSIIDPGELEIITNSELGLEPSATASFYGKGYVILFAGDSKSPFSGCSEDDRSSEAAWEIYDNLIDLGYTDEEIYFLNKFAIPGGSVDGIGSSGVLQSAIETWAASRANNYKPLYIILFDHGGSDSGGYVCSCHSGNRNDRIYAPDLRDWIDTLVTSNDCFVHVWIMACHSGSFINDLSRRGFVTITSTDTERNTHGAAAPYHELFTESFWPEIVNGASWLEAFNTACYHSHSNSIGYVNRDGDYKPPNLPLLDDDGNGVGHGLYDAHFTPPADLDDTHIGDLPRAGDGNYAYRIHMNWLRLSSLGTIVTTSPYYFKGSLAEDEENSGSINVWAEVQDPDYISKVEAIVVSPEVTQEVEDEWYETEYEHFEMTDPDNDGKYTVDIPETVFEKYMPKHKDFNIHITAEWKNGQRSPPLKTGVSYPYGEQAYIDDVQPFINIHYPRDGEIVGGALTIQGMASDNIELEKIEIYFDNKKIQQIDTSSCSHYYIVTSAYNLSETTGGHHTVKVKVYDTSGNVFTDSREVYVIASGPYKPTKPSGEQIVKPNEKTLYSAKSDHSEQEQLWYLWDWDDGSDSGWQGPYQSGILVEGSHSWGEKGYFKVRVKSRDRYGVESEFSDALFVKVGQGKSKSLMKQSWFITIFWKMLNLPLFIRVVDFI